MRRLEIRAIRAEIVCRELRHAIANPPQADWNQIVNYLIAWMEVAPKKVKYTRPSDSVLREFIPRKLRKK